MIDGGVYKITNTTNGKFYVGSSKNIKKRWNEHKWALKNGRHWNAPMQNAFNKYGDVFSYEVIEEASEELLLRDREQHYIESLGACKRSVGYNLSEMVNCVCLSGERHWLYGKTWSEEAKKKLSNSISGQKHPLYGTHVSKETKEKMRKTLGSKLSGKNHPLATKVMQLTDENVPIKVWDYIKQATIETGFDNSSIIKCCKGKYKTVGGFKWRYYDDYIKEFGEIV